MIRITGLTAGYGEKTVLDGFSLTLPQGGVTLLSGASGAGKTTLLRVLAGLLRPRSGTVELPGRPILLFQEDRLFPGLTARAQVEAALPKSRRGEAGRSMALAELENDGGKLPGELSGGMARRVALARCLAAGETLGAAVYLLDEPFAGVDPERGARILARLRELDKTILLTGHDRALAGMCDREIRL